MDPPEPRINPECFAALRAAARRTGEGIAAVKEALTAMREAEKHPSMSDSASEQLRLLSRRFYRSTVCAAHNALLTAVCENLYELLDVCGRFAITSRGISESSFVQFWLRRGMGKSPASSNHIELLSPC